MNHAPERIDPYDLDVSSRVGHAPSAHANHDPLVVLRSEITQLDSRLIALLAERVALARSARDRKEGAGIDIYDPEREAAVVRHAASTAEHVGLDTEEVREIFWRIVRMSRDAQRTSAEHPEAPTVRR